MGNKTKRMIDIWEKIEGRERVKTAIRKEGRNQSDGIPCLIQMREEKEKKKRKERKNDTEAKRKDENRNRL